MQLPMQFTILAIIFMHGFSALSRNDYLVIRNNYLKQYFGLKNPLLKKTSHILGNKIYIIYHKYVNLYHRITYQYYSITQDDWALIDGITSII
jgi:hypothetical protein